MDLIIEPMGSDFILWRCLHGGPLGPRTIDAPEPHPEIDWTATRARNLPLLKKLIETYGTCAIVARRDDEVIGALRFYPKALCTFSAVGGVAFCLQQAFPAGPKDDLVVGPFPPLDALADKTLFVHCLMIVAPKDEPARYRRKGVATQMALEMVRWARDRGWQAIEAYAYEEIPTLYEIAGVAGRRFWRKIGFRIVQADTEPGLTGELLETVRAEAVAAGIPAERAADRFKMRLDLSA